MKILLVDDDQELSLLASTVLRQGGHKTLMAVDASQVLPSAQREKPDLILLDVNMPGGNGTQLLVRLKRSTLTSGIPVIVVSGAQDAKLPSQVVGLGAEGFLPKPWTPETLVENLKRLAPHLAW